MGKISDGLVVFDWDFRKGYNRKEEGMNHLFPLYKEAFPELTNTLVVETPNGYHWYYKMKSEPDIKGMSNCGFSDTLKRFKSYNDTYFPEYLKGLDIKAGNSYVVMPPSKIDGKEYKWINEKPPIEINREQFDKVLNWFKISDDKKAENRIRKGFVDIILGKVNPHDLKGDDKYEHVYWKEMFHECWRVGKLQPEEVLKGVIKHQKGLDEGKTREQLNNQKNKDYIFSNSRLSKEKYEFYFNITPHPTKLEESKIEDVVFDDIEVDEDDDIFYFKGRGNIVPQTDGLYLEIIFKKTVEVRQVLEGCLRLEKMNYDKMNNNNILLTGVHDGQPFRTLPLSDLLNRLNNYTYQGNTGKDVVKKYIHIKKKTIPIYDLSYVLGFNDHWSLPSLEEVNKTQIVVSTDKQIEAYERSKNIITEYDDNEKEEIKTLMKEFLNITKIDSSKMAIIIGWAIAAPFRHVFINFIDLFPMLCAYGNRKTGKTSLLKFFCVDFYKIHNKYPSVLLSSKSQFEDVLSSSSFPVFIEEVIAIPLEILGIIKEHTTGSSNFFRKKNAREKDFDSLKSAPLAIDCNHIIKSLMDPATNSKLTLIPFMEEEEISVDLKWVNLRKDLRKYKLFSLLYDYTKDWTVKSIEAKISEYMVSAKDVITDKDEKHNPRILQQYIIIQFGIDLFKEVFDIELDRHGFLNVLRYGRTVMTQSLLNDFYMFCHEATKYEEAYTNGDGHLVRGDNPKYLNHKLYKYESRKHHAKGYFFTASNKADFQNLCREKYTLAEICEKVKDGLQDKHKNLIDSHNTGNRRGLFIHEDFFTLKIFEKITMTEDEAIREHGEIPNE